MGSGKSSIGAIVSKKLNINFVDVDLEIEKKIGMPISKIFEKEGEKYFREIEELVTLKSLKKNKTVARAVYIVLGVSMIASLLLA